jgi:hypothetical protein
VENSLSRLALVAVRRDNTKNGGGLSLFAAAAGPAVGEQEGREHVLVGLDHQAIVDEPNGRSPKVPIITRKNFRVRGVNFLIFLTRKGKNFE